MTENERLKKYVSVVPNECQKKVQDMKFYAFVHYGVNTFTDREWGDGKEEEALFNPQKQNTDQWCEAFKAAGMTGVILTAKHHDGFCLWQSKTTEHCMKNSPYKNGKGDVVAELAASCKKYGLKLGVYLSPWDRNSDFYGTEKYNDFYVEQLTELLTNYGEIFTLWLDGACGAESDGKPKQKYDFDRYFETARRLQPGIALSNCAPDIRWVGNESGVSRESEWNVVPRFNEAEQKVAQSSQQGSDYREFQKKSLDVMARDLGSRKVLSGYDEFVWYPAEVDVSIRRGWFFHEKETLFHVKSLKKLMNIYYKAVGGNTLLLLNVPPNKDGLLNEKDVRRLRQMGDEIRKQEALKLNSAMSESRQTARGYEFDLSFEKTRVDRVIMEENTDFSQRIESFDIYALDGEKETKLYSGTVVGFGKIAIFKPVETSKLRVVITECRFEPHMRFAHVCKEGAYRV